MATMELEVGKLELIRQIININSDAALESIRLFIQDLMRKNEAVDDDTLMSKQEFFAKIDRAKASIERGEGTRVRNTQELHSFLNSL